MTRQAEDEAVERERRTGGRSFYYTNIDYFRTGKSFIFNVQQSQKPNKLICKFVVRFVFLKKNSLEIPLQFTVRATVAKQITTYYKGECDW